MFNLNTLTQIENANTAQVSDIITENEVRVLFNDHGQDPIDYLADNRASYYTIDSVLAELGY